ncbi:MAG: ABC transporter ATP-binding protein [Devosia sp.]|uniref:ABC transporter ATP-binding protein n=1 Tax=Devosia sp. TaxID=1871048 RepID=UPI001A400B6A|nr:ATP-binding cassette domain-containing protein [Devosia sp.]MBL8599855.1 ABC transporter ATP-binding protein [Devosia sp.]
MLGPAHEVVALNNISLTIGAGKALAVVGESGSGKSTLGRAVARLFTLSSGTIFFKGKDIARLHRRDERHDYQRSVQMVFQDPFSALNPAHTIQHHLERPLVLHRKLRGAALDAAVREVCTDVELDPEATLSKYPHELSGGQRQRVNLARALAVGAELIIADEPTSMLDVSIRRSVLDLMRRMKETRAITFLYITHDIATAQFIADEIAIMYAGQVVEWGLPKLVIANPQHPYTRLLLSAVPDPAVRLDEKDGRSFSSDAQAVRALAKKSTEDIREVQPGHYVRGYMAAS